MDLCAVSIHGNRFANKVNRVSVKVTPDVFMQILTRFRVLPCRPARLHRTVSSLVVAIDIEAGDQSSGILERRLLAIDVYNRAEFMHPQQFPAAAVMIALPAAVEYVRESEIAILGRR